MAGKSQPGIPRWLPAAEGRQRPGLAQGHRRAEGGQPDVTANRLPVTGSENSHPTLPARGRRRLTPEGTDCGHFAEVVPVAAVTVSVLAGTSKDSFASIRRIT